jgi:XTP/dITP diphosphohydrolase
MELIFATHNPNKVAEIQNVIGDSFKIKTLTEIGHTQEIEEPFDTIEKNSEAKAQFIWQTYKANCFSEDTGLIVPALNGEPGVLSARYAGPNATAEENIDKLLAKMKGNEEVECYFKTVITLIINGEQNQFTGECRGILMNQRFGAGGFGYDPIFMPDGAISTFAEMDLQEKNMFSHRKRATGKLLGFLGIKKGK